VDKISSIEFIREMGVTHSDFFRLLPRAMGEHSYEVVGTVVRGQVHAGTVEITIGEQQVRRIALMAIPFAEVKFTFRGVSAVEQEAFQSYFDLRFQRGGG